MTRAILKKGKEGSAKRFHPWIFSGAIYAFDSEPVEGEWVEVYDHKKIFLGMGHFHDGRVAIRIQSFDKIKPDINYWKTKLQSAITYRNEINLPNIETTVYRLIHGEGDGIPGLIIDIYNDVAVMQSHSSGIHLDRKIIAKALSELMNNELESIYYKSETTLHAEVEDEVNGFLEGKSSSPVTVIEHGFKFSIDFISGQKTGFFVDQRENRNLLRQYANGKNLLNTFCYTGGFSVYAMDANAKNVDSVDVSKLAIEMSSENIQNNFPKSNNHREFTEDTFSYLEKTSDIYDLIILDPPAFAKNIKAKHNAVKGYQRLNAMALKSIRKGGIIFTFSCSQHIDRELFYNTIVSAAIIAKRKVRVLHHLFQAPDHPVSAFHPEGEYLKGIVLYVE